MTVYTRTRGKNSGTSSYSKNNYSDSMSDMLIPNFEKRRDAGELMCNPMVKEHIAAEAWTGNVKVYYQEKYNVTGVTTSKTFTGTWAKHYWTPNNGAWPYWSNLARTKAQNEIEYLAMPSGSDHERDVAMTAVSSEIASGIAQTLVTLAESKKTLSMICKAVRLLRTPVRTAMMGLGITYRRLKADPWARVRVMEKASELWMEARYGWRPFIYDVIAHADAYMAMEGAGSRLRKSNMYKAWSGEDETVLATFKFSTSLKMQVRLHVMKRFWARWKCGQTADFHEALTGPVRLFGLVDPVGTVWELIPFSWVVDKFVNIREMALSMQAYVLCTERIGYGTFECAAECDRTISYPLGKGPITDAAGMYTSWVTSDNFESGTNSGHEIVLTKNRIVLDNFTPVMGAQDALQWEEYIDLAALLAVLTNRFRPKAKQALPW